MKGRPHETTSGAKSPALWGMPARLAELFPPPLSIEATRRHFAFRYRSPAHWLEVFETWYGPVRKAFEALEHGARVALRRDLSALLARFDRAKDGTLVVASEYLEVVITR